MQVSDIISRLINGPPTQRMINTKDGLRGVDDRAVRQIEKQERDWRAAHSPPQENTVLDVLNFGLNLLKSWLRHK